MTVERQRYRLPNRKTKRTRSDSVGETAGGQQGTAGTEQKDTKKTVKY